MLHVQTRIENQELSYWIPDQTSQAAEGVSMP